MMPLPNVRRLWVRMTMVLSSLTLTVAIALVASPVVAIAAPTSPPNTLDQAAISRPLDPMMRIQQPLDIAATQIQQLATTQHLAGFTGTALDLKSRKVRLYWHGSVSASMLMLLHKLSQTVTVEVWPSPYSYSLLDSEARRLINSVGSSNARNVIDVSALPDFSGLQITFDQTISPSITNALLAQIQSPVKTIAKLGRRGRSFACPNQCSGGRWNDKPPFWGGDAITRPDGGACSTSFEAYHAGDQLAGMLTAAHCGFNMAWKSASDGQNVGTSAGCCTSIDTMPVTLGHSLPTEDYKPYMHVGAWNSWQASPIVNSGTNPQNAQRCLGGAFTGEVCGNVVTSGLVYFDPGDGNGPRGPGVWVQQQNGVPSAGNGDSGGPMYTVDLSTGNITAMGLIEGSDSPGNTCTGLPSAPNRQCSAHIFVIDLISALNQLNAGLVVFGPPAYGNAYLPTPNSRSIMLASGGTGAASNSRYIYLAAGNYDWSDQVFLDADGTVNDILAWNPIYLAADTYLWTDYLIPNGGNNYIHSMSLCGSAGNCTYVGSVTQHFVTLQPGTYSWIGILSNA